ncbi:MAG: single-stranded DNA-binding protein [Candidatus Gastranaerophilales bacterium]|nr:single-stranded DNA-binding protein [Candidatus Gastranaerophilales bacterium]
MSISKAVIMGTVVRDPEKRYTTNNIPITSFSINISNKDESLVRIITKGKLAEITADTVKKDKIVVIEGRLQTYTAKTTSGTDKKGVEIDAQAVEVVGETARAASEDRNIEGPSYDEEISSDDLIGEDEIPF